MHTKSKRIKVAFLLFDANYVTSTYKIVELLAEKLNKKVFDPVVICFLATEKKQLAGVPIFSLRSFKKVAIASAWSLGKLIKKEKIDIVVASNTGPNMTAVLAKLLFRSRIRTIIIEHNTFSLHEGQNPIKKMLASFLYPRADSIIGVSQGVVQDLINLFPRIRPYAQTIYNCLLTSPDILERLSSEPIDHPWFAPNKDLPVILNVGELFPRKGQDILVQAFALVKERMAARLVSVGTIIEPFHGKLEQLTKELGIRESVAFLGYQNNPFKYMRQADIFVLSSFEEGFGLVLIEAMACRCPVISTDCQYGPNEIIVTGKNGLLIPVGDPEAMAEAIISVLKDRALAEHLRQQGLERVNFFNFTTFVQNYEQIILELCQPVEI